MENINDVYGCNPFHADEGKEHGKIDGNTTFEIDDFLWVVHESWCCVKSPLTLNRRLQEGQGMWGHEGEDCMMDIGKVLNGCASEVKKTLVD